MQSSKNHIDAANRKNTPSETGSSPKGRRTLKISYRTVYFLLIANIIVIILCIIVSQVMLQRVGRWLAVSSHIEQADAIIVLGGGSQERILYSIQLYHEGYAPELWYTGADQAEQSQGLSDAEYFFQIAMSNGVRENAITFLPSTSTWEDAGSIKQMLENRSEVEKVILVTSWYHLRRSLNVINKRLNHENSQIYYSSSNNLHYAPGNWWTSERGIKQVVIEITKHSYYLVRYGVVPWKTFYRN